MSTISISIESVRHRNEQLKGYAAQLSQILGEFLYEKAGIDYRIQSRRNIGQRAINICRSLGEIESQLNRLISFQDMAANLYQSTENKLSQKAEQITASHRLEDRLFQFYGRFLDHGQLVALRELGLNAIDAYLSNVNRMTFSENLQFKMYVKNGNVYIRIKNGTVQSLSDFKRYYDELKQTFGGSGKWDRPFVTQLVNEGVPLYNINQSQYFKSNKNKLYNTPFDNLKEYLDEFQLSSKERAIQSMKSQSAAALKVWDDFRGWKEATTISKLTKSSGIIGTTVMTFDNFFDSFYDAENKEWDFSNGQNKQEFMVGLGVDLAAAGAAAATGAAIGSLFVPPIGTAVGAVAGVTAGFALEYPFIGDPPESIVDFTKSKINNAIDYFQENNWSDIGRDLSSKASKISDSVKEATSNFIEGTGDFISGIGKNMAKLIW